MAHCIDLQGFRYSSKTGKLERWFKPSWINEQTIPSQPLDLSLVRVRIFVMRARIAADKLATWAPS